MTLCKMKSSQTMNVSSVAFLDSQQDGARNKRQLINLGCDPTEKSENMDVS